MKRNILGRLQQANENFLGNISEDTFLLFKNLITVLSVIFSFSFYVRCFFPGYLTPDSIYILNMATGRVSISNWHPQFYVGIMQYLETSFQHTEIVWLIQVVSWISACFFLAKSLTTLPMITFLLLVLFPPIAANMAALWKDDWAVVATLISLSFAIKYTPDGLRSHSNFFSVIFASLAFLIRPDYLIIVLPIFAIIIHKDIFSKNYMVFNSIYFIKFSVKYLFVAYIVIIAFSWLVSPDTKTKKNPWIPIVAWDIAGVAARSQEFSYVRILGKNYDRDFFKSRYNCNTSDALVFTDGSLPINLPEGTATISTEEEASTYRSLWWQTLKSHPMAYAQHRLCVIGRYLGIIGEIPHYPYPFGISRSDYLPEFKRSKANIDIYWSYDAWVKTFIWRPYIWIITSISVILLVWRTRFRTLSIVLALMSLASAARGMVLPAADIRYGLWMFAGGAISVILPVLALKEAISNRMKPRQL